jgi:PAS domain-containing protein
MSSADNLRPVEPDLATGQTDISRLQDAAAECHALLAPQEYEGRCGIWLADLTSGLLFWSEAVYPLYGFEVSEGPIDFARAMSCYHPDDMQVLLDVIEHVTRHGEGFVFRLRLRAIGSDAYRPIICRARYRKNGMSEEIYGAVALLARDQHDHVPMIDIWH